MARHWSAFVPGVTPRQAAALDNMAEAHAKGNGMDLLTELTGYSSSKIGRMDRLSLRKYVDEAFRTWGRDASAS
jgi:hypothetical protein